MEADKEILAFPGLALMSHAILDEHNHEDFSLHDSITWREAQLSKIYTQDAIGKNPVASPEASNPSPRDVLE